MNSRVRARDAATGKELWSNLVNATAVANTAVFTPDGVDYVVLIAGGNCILKPKAATKWCPAGWQASTNAAGGAAGGMQV